MNLSIRSPLVMCVLGLLSWGASANNPSQRGLQEREHVTAKDATSAEQTGVSLPGDNRIYKPLSPAEMESLGRDGYKRRMMMERQR